MVGYKCRSLATGHQWNEPGGVSHGEVYPFCWSDREQERADELWIEEGESDLMALVCQQPLPRHVDLMSVPGANAFPPEWVELIERYGRIVVWADNDAAGRKLAERICSLVPRARRALLPAACNDVTEFLQDFGSVEDMVLLAAAAVPVPTTEPLRRFGWKWEAKEGGEYDTLLVPVVARDVELKRKGKELVGLCPFHQEKTPSFHVNPERGVFRCQGCNVAGDVITYVQRTRGMTYQQANLWLRDFR